MKNQKVKIFPITYFDTPVLKSSFYTPFFAKNFRFKNKAKFLSTKYSDLNNEKYNELTAIYEIWKYYSRDLDFIGICHYRRYLSLNGSKALSHKEINLLISNNEIILPKKRVYWPFSLRFHYIYSLNGYFKIHHNDLLELRKTIITCFPDYEESFDKVMKRTYYHGGHIFLMKKALFDQYCDFTFRISFDLEKKLSERTDQSRYISALTEFTLDVWIEKNRLKYKEIKVYETEKVFFLHKVLIVLRRLLNG
jgi:hypothetical protein